MKKLGFVCKIDKDAALAIATQFAKKFPRPPPKHGTQGGFGGGRGGGRGDGASARRVSSSATHNVEATPASQVSAPAPAVEVPSQNKPAPPPATHNYYNEMASSDDEDEAAFDDGFVEVESKSKSRSSVYLPSTYITSSRYHQG